MFRRFGEFELLESLPAQQPLASYYLATSGERNRLLELRVFNHQLSQLGVNVQALAGKLEGLRSLSHPNLVKLGQCGVREDLAFYVTPPLESISLESYILNRGGKLPPELALDLLVPVAEALQYLHSQRLVHGAFSCDSIRIDVASERAYLGTLDVFQSLGLTNPRGASSLRQMVRFTPMLPRSLEKQRPQREGPQPAGPILTPEISQGWPTRYQTDVFLFAAVLHRALTGSHPAGVARTGQGSPEELFRFVRPSKRVPLPESFDALMGRCLSFQQAERPEHIAAFLQELRPMREEIASLAAAPVSRGEAIRRGGLDRRRTQRTGSKERRRQARRRQDRRQAQIESNPLNALGHWFLDMSRGSKFLLFLGLTLAAGMLPLFDPARTTVFSSEYQSRRLAVKNKQFDRKRIQDNLVEQAELAAGEKTTKATFERRLRVLRSFAKALSPEARKQVLPEQVMAEIHIAYAENRDKGCALLDVQLQKAYRFLQRSRGKREP